MLEAVVFIAIWYNSILFETISWPTCISKPDSSCAGTKNISDRAFVDTQNADFKAIVVRERRCAASVLNVKRHILDRFS